MVDIDRAGITKAVIGHTILRHAHANQHYRHSEPEKNLQKPKKKLRLLDNTHRSVPLFRRVFGFGTCTTHNWTLVLPQPSAGRSKGDSCVHRHHIAIDLRALM